MAEPLLNIVLYQPEIPPNTGNVGRLCVGLELRLHLVHPLGFQVDAKAVRRAGLDYWKHVDLVEHGSPTAFWDWASGLRPGGVHLFSTRGDRLYTEVPVQPGDALVFGCETKGLPAELVARHGAYTIPMTGPVRSLNLSNAVAVATYAALERVGPRWSS